MIYIPLPGGRVARVDACDAEFADYHWSVDLFGSTVYSPKDTLWY